MLKTISAALLAASVIAAPAFAADSGKADINKTDVNKTATTKTTQAPVIKADQTQSKLSTTAAKPVKNDVKADAKADTRSKAMNANAAVTPDEHHKMVRSHRHHHKHLSANKQLKAQPESGSKQAPTSDKRS